MAALRIGQRLQGKLGVYTITKQVYETVWIARSAAISPRFCGTTGLTGMIPSNFQDQPVVIKSIRHVRLENERNILKRFQDVAPLRPMIDEIQEPREPPAIVLKHYGCHVGEIADKNGLFPREARHISRRVLEALRVLHKNGFVHTGSIQGP